MLLLKGSPLSPSHGHHPAIRAASHPASQGNPTAAHQRNGALAVAVARRKRVPDDLKCEQSMVTRGVRG